MLSEQFSFILACSLLNCPDIILIPSYACPLMSLTLKRRSFVSTFIGSLKKLLATTIRSVVDSTITWFHIIMQIIPFNVPHMDPPNFQQSRFFCQTANNRNKTVYLLQVNKLTTIAQLWLSFPPDTYIMLDWFVTSPDHMGNHYSNPSNQADMDHAQSQHGLPRRWEASFKNWLGTPTGIKC